MGTSGSYTPSPKWSEIKTDLTTALNDGPLTDDEAHELVGDFVQQLCDEEEEGFGDLPADFTVSPEDATEKLTELLAPFPLAPAGRQRVRSSGPAMGAGAGGRSRSRQPTSRKSAGTGRGRQRGRARGGSAVRPVAQRLAGFISEVPKVGLRQALINAGVHDVDTLPPDRIALAVADVLLADASLLIQAELRAALATVLEKVCDQPATLADAEEMFSNSAYDLQNIVQMLFECYIMERFKTLFCEHEAAKHGYEATDRTLSEARQYVASEMQLEQAERKDLTAVNWASEEGAKIVDAILARTVAIYSDT
jgi:hypothetical protein